MVQKIILFLFIYSLATAQISSREIDELVEKTLVVFDVPGIAVAVIKDGKIVHSKGYGVTDIVTKEKVNENTLFGIASNSKAFTTAAIAKLVDEKKMSWDDKVIKYLPEFAMYDNYVTKEFTVRDLVCHRSGLGLGAGDLMFWPGGTKFNSKDVVKKIRFLKPVSGFRTKYDYDNLLYIVAGEVIEKVSGKSWCDFVEESFIKPLGMTRTASTFVRLKDTTNTITPHVPVEGKLIRIPRYKDQIFDAAAGLYSSVNDMSKWMIALMNKGKYDTNKQLFSEKQLNEMWQLQTIIPVNATPPFNTRFSGYGLGWFLADVGGFKQISHSGGLEGIVTQVTMIPEIGLGIVVLTNQQSGSAFSAISNTIKSSYLKLEYVDYITRYKERETKSFDEANKIYSVVWNKVNMNTDKMLNKTKIIGSYTDKWFGRVFISENNGKLIFKAENSPKLEGEVFYHKDNQYVVKWNNRYFTADAFLNFEVDKKGKFQKLKMVAISDITDFSYDFHDLDFIREK